MQLQRDKFPSLLQGLKPLVRDLVLINAARPQHTE